MTSDSASPTFKPGFNGWAYRNDKFYRFLDDRIVVIRGGDDPATWCKTADRPYWRSSRMMADREFGFAVADDCPGFGETTVMDRCGRAYVQRNGQMLLPDLSKALNMECCREMAYARLHDSVPAPVRERVAQVAGRRWHLYQLLARSPGAADLFDSNPALCCMLASHWAFRSAPITHAARSARRLANRKRTVILEALGLPPLPAVERIMRVIPAQDATVRQMFYFRRAVADERVRRKMAHLPLLNYYLLRALCDPAYEPLLAPSFLAEWAARPYDPEKRNWRSSDTVLFADLQDYAQMARIWRGRADMPPLRSIASLHRRHDRLVRALMLERARHEPNVGFPAAPFQGNEDVQPVADYRELVRESEELRHCGFSYRDRILKGEYAVYRALKPERATIGLVRVTDGWRVHQIRGLGNRPVDLRHADAILRALGFVRKAQP